MREWRMRPPRREPILVVRLQNKAPRHGWQKPRELAETKGVPDESRRHRCVEWGARTPHFESRYRIEAHIRALGLPNRRTGEGAGGERWRTTMTGGVR